MPRKNKLLLHMVFLCVDLNLRKNLKCQQTFKMWKVKGHFRATKCHIINIDALPSFFIDSNVSLKLK
jgi:hypothetical protein